MFLLILDSWIERAYVMIFESIVQPLSSSLIGCINAQVMRHSIHLCFTSLFNSNIAKYPTFYLKLTVTLLNKSLLQGGIMVVRYRISTPEVKLYCIH